MDDDSPSIFKADEEAERNLKAGQSSGMDNVPSVLIKNEEKGKTAATTSLCQMI
ncbi:hypothetical protein DPMN_121023 [Dreissena polymorpha]|uniref:Uncharacterized protein n=1 Tax=Dreissena polymorpha TaxID=45954 RepID=A0A9D4JQQ6_DREPO|nr:hypothetical protein DPMN_121023 [Dreissena polymorpha]